jgi:soluble lytic murein transglycosylase-like protein/rubrerythrin
MTTAIDFAKLDLRAALDFAILVEEDAQLRYERLSRALADDSGGAGPVFRSMVATEGTHRARLIERRASLLGDGLPPIEISALDHAVEGPDLEDDLPATAHEALRLAIAGEQRAHDFFARAIPFIEDPSARAFFAELQREEVEHRDLLAARLAALGPGPECAPPRRAPATVAREAPPPDAAELRNVLPRVDAATRAIAAGILVDGLGPHEMADALGVSPATVERKWRGFLLAARQHLAVGLAAAALAGCVGPRGAPSPTSAAAPSTAAATAPATAAAPAHAPLSVVRELPAGRTMPDGVAARATTTPPEDRSAMVASVHSHVAARMPRVDPATRRRIAQTVIAEAQRAALDPLLVLAVIHVESSFNPEVVSHAGAVGLMQLLEPTFRRELERNGLAGEPTDPVTNVRAGVRYLRRLVDAFGGSMDLALMAYNAGPNRIGGHLRKGGIPERYFSYPRKVNQELERLRSAAGGQKAFARVPNALPRAG